ncbi:hypothetical protein ACIA5C_42025 [Actinoplanes sp. NPDC051343]|uniref:hypothetical protein n=1 Tax=Actinoplanes sp. NPDC051343 TaxID=3363906 RepID=UPI00378B497B
MRIAVRLGQVLTVVLLAVATFALVHSNTSPQPQTVAAGAPPATAVGPDGIGRLRLGMTLEQADATGDLKIATHWLNNGSTCTIVELAGGGYAHFSRHHGLAVITAPPAAATPEGIRAGATIPQIAAAYPKYRNPEFGTPAEQVRLFGDFLAPVPGNASALYVFFFTAGSDHSASPTLKYLLLILSKQDGECTHAAE